MNSLWKIIRNTLGVVGAFLVYGGVSTCDYYTMELGTTEPEYIMPMIFVGVVMLIPTVIHVIGKNY